MIESTQVTTNKVADHYDELDQFYREVWGNHVHHGYWKTGRETPEQATVELIKLMSSVVDINKKQTVCDIGCGYGATARYLAENYGCQVQGFTISKNQIEFANTQNTNSKNPTYKLVDWMHNGLDDHSIDFAYSIESSEHMPNFNQFFSEASRVLKPGSKFAIYAWLEPKKTKPWMIRHLLQPLCDEGRMRLATVAEYENRLNENGFKLLNYTDISSSVSRTWTICIRRAALKILTQRKYQKFLFSNHSQNRDFAKTIVRIRAAFAVGAMEYGLFIAQKL